jgi:acetyltransferase-like isoleucine patch superfamily enzyme
MGGEVQIGEGTLVGIGATVMSQRTIGMWSTVGAGALVQRDLPARVTAYGVPAQIKRQIVFEREFA